MFTVCVLWQKFANLWSLGLLYELEIIYHSTCHMAAAFVVIIHVSKRLRSCKLEGKSFNCQTLLINESSVFLEEALA